jgi:hypothetical protein
MGDTHGMDHEFERPSIGGPDATPTDAIPSYAPPATAPPSRSRRVGVIVGVVAVVAVLGAAVVAIASAGNGANTPDEAVRAFTQRASAEDIVGATRLLAPTEVGSAADLYDLVIRVAQKHKALGPDGKPLAGVDVQIRDLEVESTTLHSEVAKVRLVAGTLSVKADPAKMDPRIRAALNPDSGPADESITIAEIEDQIAQAATGLETDTTTPKISGVFLMTVKVDGKWYVSPTYTMFEYAREAFGLPAVDYDASRAARGPGATTPEDVVSSMIEFLNSVDTDTLADRIEKGESAADLGVRGALAPGEFGAYLDYLPVLAQLGPQLLGTANSSAGSGTSAGSATATTTPNSRVDTGTAGGLGALSGLGSIDPEDRQQIADAIRGVHGTWKWSADTATEKLADGRTKVVLRSGSLDLTARGSLADTDFDATVRGRLTKGVCAEATSRITVDGETHSDSTSGCLDPATDLGGLDLADGFFIVTVRRDGKWYFSPIETIVEYARLALEADLAK